MKTLYLLFCIVIFASPAMARNEIQTAPRVPSPVIDLVYTRTFVLEKSYIHDWSKDRQAFKSGTLVVLKVDPEFVIPRNAAEPVLYAGNQTAKRLNHGHHSGHVIAIIPGDLDLTKDPIWFGSPDLPERVTAQTIKSQRRLAEAKKIQPFSSEKIKKVTRRRLQESDLSSMLRNHVADLVLKYSPQEKDLAEKWRLPVARILPKDSKPEKK